MNSQKHKKSFLSTFLAGAINLKLALLLLCMLVLVVPAFATHTSSASLEPEWSPAGQTVNYTVTISNSGPDSVDEVRIYRNMSYTNFQCDEKTGWEKQFIVTKQACHYIAEGSDYYIDSGESDTFTFSATTPGSGCEFKWDFESRDVTFPNTGSINYLDDNTSVDDVEPMIIKELGKYLNIAEPNTCLKYLSEDGNWVTQDTPITIEVYDQGECGVSGLDYCEYRYDVDGVEKLPWTVIVWNKIILQGEKPYYFDTEHYMFAFTFDEDSEHSLEVRCYDIAGNEAYHSQTVFVETVPPETTKSFSGPQKIEGEVEWIDGITEVVLDAIDPEPHPSGVDKIWYANILAEDERACSEPELYCTRDINFHPDYITGFPSYKGADYYMSGCIDHIQRWCKEYWSDEDKNFSSWQECTEFILHDPYQPCVVLEDWHIYTEPFTKDEESCHILQYFSVDNVGNVEDMQVNCFFVDKTPPVVDKQIGEPAIEGYEEEGIGAFHWVTPETDITFTCTDQEPHPSGDEELCFKVSYDEPEWHYITEDYCEGELEDGYCCVSAIQQNPFVFNFNEDEDSLHDLEYYCRDAVGKESEPEIQYYKVDSTPPSIEKMIWDPKYLTEDANWITQNTNIRIKAYADEECSFNDVDYCEYRYDVDGEEALPWTVIEWTRIADALKPEGPPLLIYHFDLNFNEDSEHFLEVRCYDLLGNMSYHSQTEYVETVPPETTKSFDGPQKIEGEVEWINGITKVVLDAIDPEPHPSGIDKMWYINTLTEGDDACWNPSEYCEPVCDSPYNNPEDAECIAGVQAYCSANYDEGSDEWKDCVEYGVYGGSGGFGGCGISCNGQQWKLYREPFTKEEESCHLLQYFSVDNLGSAEEMKVNCFFVDQTPPIVEKDNGEAIADSGEEMFITEENPDANFHWISKEMPITFTCTDQGPHPSEDEELCFKVSYDYPDWGYITEEYCSEGTINEEGYCCVDATVSDPYEFYFQEDSMHNLEYYCQDAVEKKGDLHIQYYKVDTEPPAVEKLLRRPYYGDCPPEPGSQDQCFVDTRTTIDLEIEDRGDICAIGDVVCRWRYRVNEGEWSNWSSSFPITFPEECQHDLELECWDALGNKWSETEHFIVDKTPPVTTKSFEGPQIVDGNVKWINTNTEIVLNSEDQLPHPSGENMIWYANILAEDERACSQPELYCTRDINFHPDYITGFPSYKGADYYMSGCIDHIQRWCKEYWSDEDKNFSSWQECTEFILHDPYQPCVVLEDWHIYTEPFTKDEQSCHILQYFGVDNVGKAEEMHVECFFVDNTAPETAKEVGEPKDEWTPGREGDENSMFYPEIDNLCWLGEDPLECWKVTLLTPITLECVDQEPHPVDNDHICFYVEWDGDDVTEDYCESYVGDYNANDDGFCCTEGTIAEFYFEKETEHNLKYYCVDALGNKGEIDDEKFKVEGTKFEIQINKKWNLISVPFVLINDDIGEVLKDIDTNVQAVWAYDAFADKWYVYNPDSPETSNLETIEPGWGYWLSAYGNDTLVLGGSLFSPATTPTSRQLKEGWNLIGYYGVDGVLKYDGPDGEGKQAGCALWSLGESYADKGWTALFTYWEPDNPDQWKELDYYSRMDPGAGYWISIAENGTYSYTTTCGLP